MAVLPSLVGGEVLRVDAPPGARVAEFCDALAAVHQSARVFRVRGFPAGEPLGALRAALRRAQETELLPPTLELEHLAMLETLLDGDGLDLESAASLVAAWLGAGQHGFETVIVLEDAAALDADSAEAMKLACASRGIALLGCLEPDQSLPPALAALPLCARFSCVPFDPASVQAERDRRWGELSEAEQRVLQVVATAGGGIELGLLEAALARIEASFASELRRLDEAGWLTPAALGGWQLAAADAAAIRRQTPAAQRAAWHGALALALAQEPPSLGFSRAALHALSAGDSAGAARLARTASSVAFAAGMEATARALQQFAEEPDAAPLRERGLTLDADPVPSGAGRPVLPSIDWFTPSPPPAEVSACSDIDELLEISIRTDPVRSGHALTELLAGRPSHALSVLERARLAAGNAGERAKCRLGIAFGISLARSGRRSEALLEALSALAAARRGKDVRGERACARLLAELSRAAGAEMAAARWELITTRQTRSEPDPLERAK